MRLTIIGSGYVGLVSGVCFADFGHDVTCVDNDASKIEALNAGKVPIYEPDLDRLIASNTRDGRLLFTTDLRAAMKGSDAVFISVGTPSRGGDGHADLQFIYAAAAEIAECVDGYTVVFACLLLAAGARVDSREPYGIIPLETAIYHAARASVDVLAAIALVPDAPWAPPAPGAWTGSSVSSTQDVFDEALVHAAQNERPGDPGVVAVRDLLRGLGSTPAVSRRDG